MTGALSAYLDLLRFLSAALVFVVHANEYEITGGLPVVWRFSGLGWDAVMVFFVLSGLVIAYVSDAKEKLFSEYLVSRLSRLYSVTIPALFLTILLDYLGARISPEIYASLGITMDAPLLRIATVLTFTNQLWFTSVTPFSNIPFWSLGYEFWYYAIFACLYYFSSGMKYLGLVLLCLVIGPKIMILFPVWLLGALTYFAVRERFVGESLGWLFFIGPVLAYLGFRQSSLPQHLHEFTAGIKLEEGHDLGFSKDFLQCYLIGSLISLHFVGAGAISHRLKLVITPVATPIRYLAGYTFAAYLFHYPLLVFFAAAASTISNSSVRTTIIVIGTMLSIWALGSVTEKKKTTLKKWLVSLRQ